METGKIGPYDIIEKIAEGGMGVVYKAIDSRSKAIVAIKTIKDNVDRYSETFLRFKREAELLGKLAHNNVLKFIDFIEKDSRLFIVTEYLQGKSLKQVIIENNYSIDKKVSLILQIARALDYVHSQEIIHRDIKPSNISVLNDDSVKILDFGVANLMNFQKLFINKEGIVGSFAYMSPEQSGILKRNIDSRSDLYSLGILFYHLITGQLPYNAKQVGELIHQHIAQIPEEPQSIVSGLSPIINKIILKLIKKDPDDRYQTAFGLAEDLELYLTLDEKQKNTFYLELAKKDRLKNLNYRTAQIGRKKEIRTILNHLNNTVLNKGFVTTVIGKSGMGKSRLLAELQKYARGKNSILVQTTSSEGNQNHPYYPFIRAVKLTIDLLSKIPEKEANEIYNDIKNNLGDEGRILSKIIPEISEILGEYSTEIKFSKKESEIFFEKLRDFFITVAKVTHPLILTFDDAHFWDTGSIQFFNYLKEFIEENSIYIIISMREEETLRVKELFDTITKEAQEGRMNVMTLHELNSDDVEELIDEIFGLIYNGKSELRSRLFESTQGNPLLIIENVKTLVEEQIISQKKNGWVLDQNKLSVFRFSSSIVDKILTRLSKIDRNTIMILSYASVLGKEFYFDILGNILSELQLPVTREELLNYLNEGIYNGLVAESLNEKGEIIYTFVHDKIIETFLAQMPSADVKLIHRIAAKIIEENYAHEDKLYRLAYHYLMGDMRNKAYSYNVQAGRKALESFSFKLAVGFFENALNIIRNFGKSAEQTTKARISITFDIVELNLQLGDLHKNIDLLEELLPFAEELNDKENLAKIYFFIGKNYYLSGNQIKSLFYFNKVIPIAEELNLTEYLVLPYCAIGRVNVYICYFEKAIDYLEKGLALFGPINELDEITLLERMYSQGVLIQAYGYLGKKDKANGMLVKLKADYVDIKNDVFQLYLLFYIASGYIMVGQLEKGISEADRCIEVAKELKNIIIELYVNYTKGRAYSALGNYAESIRIVSKTYNAAKEINLTLGFNLMVLHLAEDYAFLGNIRFARELLEELPKYTENTNPNFVIQFQNRIETIMEISSHAPDIEKALEMGNHAIKACEELGEEYEAHLAHNLVALASVYYKADDIANGDEFFNKGVDIYKKFGLNYEVSRAERIRQKFSTMGQDMPDYGKTVDSETTHTQTHTSTASHTEFSYQRQLQYLLKLSEKLAKIHEMDVLLSTIMSLAIEVSGAERGVVFLLDDPDNVNSAFTIKAQKSIDPKEDRKEIVYSSLVVKKTIQSNKGQLILDAEEELEGDKTVSEYNMKSIITVPLATSSRLLGVIYLDNRQVKGLFTEENFELLKAFAIEASIFIENAKLYEQVQETARIEQEMEIAKDIQTSILPPVQDTLHYEMSAYMRTATEVGGDYYDFYLEDEPYFGVFGDVSGHGLKSGLVMMMAEVSFNTIMTDNDMRNKPLSELYQKINATLYKNIQQRLAKKSNIGNEYTHMYMTFRIFRFDNQGNFEMFGNDHARPFVCRKDRGEIESIDSTGFLIGIIKDAGKGDGVYSYQLNSGDLLCLYSDGITEAKRIAKDRPNNDYVREMFGEERLFSVISENRDKSPDEIIKAVLSSVDEWMDEQEDDITLAIIKKK